MKRLLRMGLMSVFVLAVLLLNGCSGISLTLDPQDLYRLPKLPAEYTELNQHINDILSDGAEYAAPLSGTNIQPVQLVDLDGDGQEEAVAFFRKSGDERPLKIYIFAADRGGYKQAALIEGMGTGIYSIAYNDLNADGWREVAIGWKTTAELQVLEIYTLRPGYEKVLLRTNYVKYSLYDLDQDQRQELVVLRADEEGGGIADYYSWQEDGNLLNQSSARISATMAELSQQGRVTAGTLQDGTPAVFVTGVTDTPRAITDILAVSNGTVSNIVLSGLTGVSSEIAPFSALYPDDINDDGVTEVPVAVYLPRPSGEDSPYQQIEWRAYDTNGTASVSLRTYHNTEDGWYLRLPEEWNGRIYVGRSSGSDESVVTFSLMNNGTVEPFLRIAAITGVNREIKAVRGERFLLSRQSETIYTAELLAANTNWAYGVTADELRAAFSTILPEWTAGDN